MKRLPSMVVILIAVITCLVLVLPQPAEAGSKPEKPKITFGIFADAHYNTIQLQDFVNDMNTWLPDFVIQAGDYAQTPTIQECTDMEAIYRTTTMPRYHVRGDHDSNINWFLEYTEATELYYSFNIRNFHFIVLDDADDIVDPEQLVWLARDLRRSHKTTVVFLHRPIVPYWDNWKYPGITIQNATEVRALLENDGDVIATFSGHNHSQHDAGEEWAVCQNGIWHFSIMNLGNGNYARVSLYKKGVIRIDGIGLHGDFDSSLPQRLPPNLSLPTHHPLRKNLK